MLGLLIALLIGGYWALHSYTFIQIFPIVTHFLTHWYLITGIIILSIVALLVVLTMLGVGIGLKGVAGKFFGTIGTGIAGILVLILLTARRAMFYFGAVLLSKALVLQEGAPVWNNTNLIIGGLLILIPLLTSRTTRVSSSSS